MPKTELYKSLTSQLHDLLQNERDFIANAANVSSLIFHTLPEVSWVGFYICRNGQLVLGPFQGKPACTRIAIGKGVCGMAAGGRNTIVVENVHEFPGHIACDSASSSEIVVPVVDGKGHVIAVLDLDSPLQGRFEAEDQAGLERLMEVFVELTDLTLP